MFLKPPGKINFQLVDTLPWDRVLVRNDNGTCFNKVILFHKQMQWIRKSNTFAKSPMLLVHLNHPLSFTMETFTLFNTPTAMCRLSLIQSQNHPFWRINYVKCNLQIMVLPCINSFSLKCIPPNNTFLKSNIFKKVLRLRISN